MDDVLIKGCNNETKDLTLKEDEYCTFVKEHIEDVECILKRLEEVNFTLFFKKSIFGIKEIMVIVHLCKSYEKKVNIDKIDAIARMKICKSTTKIKKYLYISSYIDSLLYSYCGVFILVIEKREEVCME